ncbi:hypothetical protein [Ornithinibacillus californiensis]|nr:hypothetical protein [Ornithinibacillus californiensis]
MLKLEDIEVILMLMEKAIKSRWKNYRGLSEIRNSEALPNKQT